jgi:ACS family glucarate transporter-like MFS transporter
MRAGLNATQTKIVALLFGFSMLSYLDRTIMSIAGPGMIRDFGISPSAMGSVYSAFILGYALLMIPGGHLADRIGARRTLLWMGLGSAVFTGFTVFGGTPGLGALIGVVPALFAIRFLLGVVTAPLYPACARVNASWIPVVYHGRVQGLIIAGSSVGAAIAPFVFTSLVERYPWQVPFLAASLVTAALAAVWFWYARDTPGGDAVARHPASASSSSWAGLFANRNLLLLTYAYGVLGYFQYIFFYWMYYYFGDVLHMSAADTTKYTTFLFLTEGVMMPLGGLASDRLTRRYGAQLGRRFVPVAGLALGAAFTVAGAASVGFVAVLCLSLAFGLGAFCEGPFWAIVTEIGGEQAGGAGSILNTGAQIGGFFAPIATPWIASWAGWRWGLYAGCLIALTGVAAVWLVKMQPRAVGEPMQAGMPQ